MGSASHGQVRSTEAHRSENQEEIPFTADSENIEFMLRTIHSTNQLSIYGAVSSWCDELVEQMHGQTSTGVDRSISEEMIGYQYNWIRKKLVLWCERVSRGKRLARSLATIRSKILKKKVCNGMYHRTGEDVNDGHGNFHRIMHRIHATSEPPRF